jgi:hypothetical protein
MESKEGTMKKHTENKDKILITPNSKVTSSTNPQSSSFERAKNFVFKEYDDLFKRLSNR